MTIYGRPAQAPGAGRLASPLRFVVALAMGIVVFAPAASRGQEQLARAGTMDPQLYAKLKETGDLSVTNVTLPQALFTISEQWQINLVVGDSVEGQVHGVFRDAPLHEVLDAILLANGYTYRPSGKSLVIKKAGALGDINPMFQATTIPLRAVKPEDILAAVQSLSSQYGKVQAVPSARSLMVLDYPDRVQLIQTFARQLDMAAATVGGGVVDQPRELQVADFAPQFIEAKSLQEPVQAVLSDVGKVAVMLVENRLVVYDYAPAIRQVSDLIKRLDVPPQQVFISTLIYDISLTDMQRLGINWDSSVKWRIDPSGDPQSTFDVDSTTLVPVAMGDVSGMLTLMSMSRNFDITAVIDALDQARDTRLLAKPTVTALDRQPAMIRIVTEIPYQNLTQTAQGGNLTSVAFREAGVTLTVTPYISNDGTITMNVQPSFSRLEGFTTGVSPQPIINTRDAQTTVRVANGQTLVIGGLRQRSDIGDFTGIPFLKDLPGLGYLFRSRKTDGRESELVVFITPQIISPAHCGTDREQDAYHVGEEMLRRLPWAGEFLQPEIPHHIPGWMPQHAEEDLPAGEAAPEFRPKLPPIDAAEARRAGGYRTAARGGRWPPNPRGSLTYHPSQHLAGGGAPHGSAPPQSAPTYAGPRPDMRRIPPVASPSWERRPADLTARVAPRRPTYIRRLAVGPPRRDGAPAVENGGRTPADSTPPSAAPSATSEPRPAPPTKQIWLKNLLRF